MNSKLDKIYGLLLGFTIGDILYTNLFNYSRKDNYMNIIINNNTYINNTTRHITTYTLLKHIIENKGNLNVEKLRKEYRNIYRYIQNRKYYQKIRFSGISYNHFPVNIESFHRTIAYCFLNDDSSYINDSIFTTNDKFCNDYQNHLINVIRIYLNDLPIESIESYNIDPSQDSGRDKVPSIILEKIEIVNNFINTYDKKEFIDNILLNNKIPELITLIFAIYGAKVGFQQLQHEYPFLTNYSLQYQQRIDIYKYGYELFKL